jgi:hypothetical protein
VVDGHGVSVSGQRGGIAIFGCRHRSLVGENGCGLATTLPPCLDAVPVKPSEQSYTANAADEQDQQ